MPEVTDPDALGGDVEGSTGVGGVVGGPVGSAVGGDGEDALGEVPPAGARVIGATARGCEECDVSATPVPTEMATTTTATTTTRIGVVVFRRSHPSLAAGAGAAPKLMSSSRPRGPGAH
jgi:hypothetical protein